LSNWGEGSSAGQENTDFDISAYQYDAWDGTGNKPDYTDYDAFMEDKGFTKETYFSESSGFYKTRWLYSVEDGDSTQNISIPYDFDMSQGNTSSLSNNYMQSLGYEKGNNGNWKAIYYG